MPLLDEVTKELLGEIVSVGSWNASLSKDEVDVVPQPILRAAGHRPSMPSAAAAKRRQADLPSARARWPFGVSA